MSEITRILLRRGAEHRLRAGHVWVFSNEIDGDVASLPPGGAVEVRAADGAYLGRGFCNPASLISVRLLTRDSRIDVDGVDLYVERLRAALALRERLLPGRTAYRLVAGEADGLPGLIIDRYGDVLVAQIHALGMELRRPLLEEALRRVLDPKGVMLRNEAAVRLLEGLPQESLVWFGEVPDRAHFEVEAAGKPLRLVADVAGGQKTGFFFDQGENRAFAARTSRGARVLDLYANTGGWALSALMGGAVHATAVEINPATCELICDNAELNGMEDRITVIAAEVRAWLQSAPSRAERYDAVFLDPPAFAKNRKSAGAALKGYRDINRLALEVLVPGGLLFTSSCSFHVQEDRFVEEVLRGAAAAGRTLKQVRRGEQGPDHPVIPAIPETRYLKHLVFQAN